jgi:hypothetical protein
MFLGSINLPAAGTLTLAAKVRLESQLLLYPGMRVRLEAQLGDERLRQAALNSMATQLRNNGILPDPQGPVRLSLTTQQGSTGNEIRTIGFGGPSQSFQQEQMQCVLTFYDASNQARWSTTRTVSMRSFGMVQGSDAQSELRREMQQGFENMVSNGLATSGLPTYIFPRLDEILAGESEITPGGERAVPPPSKTTAPSGAGPGATFGF